MGQPSKIVELYGLPGCGKTTLRDYLVSGEAESGCSFGLMSDITRQYKSLSAFKKLGNIPWKGFVRLMRLLCRLPILPLRKWGFYKVLFQMVLLYRFSGKASSHDYYVVDHGIVQGIAGVLYGKYDRVGPKAAKRLNQLFEYLGLRFVYYCRLDIGEVVSRIRFRGRKTPGRFDAIKDDAALIGELESENVFFEWCESSLMQFYGERKILEMNASVDCIAKELKKLVEQ